MTLGSMMRDMFDTPQFDVVPLPQDLHYRLMDPRSGRVVGSVAPVVVGRPRTESGFRRFMRSVRPATNFPGTSHHIPRVTLRVADEQDSTAFFVDRADKMIGHGCVPHCAVVDAAGGVIGHVTNDHYRALVPPSGPLDADGMTLVTGTAHLLDRNRDVICDIVARVAMTDSARRSGADPRADTLRFVGPDGTLWARITGESPAVDFNPQISEQLKALILASIIAGKLLDRLHMSFVTSSYTPPEPLEPAAEPYPEYDNVHSFYMRYQEEYIEWYKKETNRRMRGIAAGTDF